MATRQKRSNLVALSKILVLGSTQPQLLTALVFESGENHWTVTLTRYNQKRTASAQSTASLDHALGLAMKELALGAGQKGKASEVLIHLSAWIEAAPNRRVEILVHELASGAYADEFTPDRYGDVWLSFIYLHVPGTRVEGFDPSLEGALRACVYDPAWKKLGMEKYTKLQR